MTGKWRAAVIVLKFANFIREIEFKYFYFSFSPEHNITMYECFLRKLSTYAINFCNKGKYYLRRDGWCNHYRQECAKKENMNTTILHTPGTWENNTTNSKVAMTINYVLFASCIREFLFNKHLRSKLMQLCSS